ncbi:hypothetical protein Syun_002518 [Stephania yunnanensis]|uniref:Beta-fructofuranosidase n=1 Tax=Stephania yunnanensis TaxID=152371 RepID=A0AAP0Q838_9MAGN
MGISRQIVWGLLMCIVGLMGNCGFRGVEASHKVYVKLQHSEAKEVLKAHRPLFHFRPPKNWMNVWAHSFSTDLINWIPLKPALYASKPFDINGTWSGSATILPGNKPVILYTGLDEQYKQVQNIAFPKDLNDPLLQEWIKPDYNPVITPTSDMNASFFRDPTEGWRGPDGHWRVLVGNRKGNRGLALLYRSRDFIHWTKAKHPLHSSADTGMWECPDFFPVSLDHTRFDYYTIGQYFYEKDRYVPDKSYADNSTGLRYDYGNFYASKTFFDAKNKRRILWGWANESDLNTTDTVKGWAGVQTVPRRLWLDENGKQLRQWPIKELETLRLHQVKMNDVSIRKGNSVEIKGITAAQADVEVTFHLPSLSDVRLEPFDPSWSVDPQRLCGEKPSTVGGELGPFGLLTLASENLEEYTAVFFRVFNAKPKPVVLMCSGGIRSSISEEMYKPSFGGFVDVDLSDRKITLRSLIDRSVVESFAAGGKTCITSRVYPKLAEGSLTNCPDPDIVLEALDFSLSSEVRTKMRFRACGDKAKKVVIRRGNGSRVVGQAPLA